MNSINQQEPKNNFNTMKEINSNDVDFKRLSKKEYSTIIKNFQPIVLEKYCERRFDRYVTTVYQLKDGRILEDHQGIYSLFLDVKSYDAYINHLKINDIGIKKMNYIYNYEAFFNNKDSIVQKIKKEFALENFRIDNPKVKEVFFSLEDKTSLLAFVSMVYLDNLKNSEWVFRQIESIKLPYVISNGAIFSPLDILNSQEKKEVMWETLLKSFN